MNGVVFQSYDPAAHSNLASCPRQEEGFLIGWPNGIPYLPIILVEHAGRPYLPIISILVRSNSSLAV